jgi:hypothetical protein
MEILDPVQYLSWEAITSDFSWVTKLHSCDTLHNTCWISAVPFQSMQKRLDRRQAELSLECVRLN